MRKTTPSVKSNIKIDSLAIFERGLFMGVFRVVRLLFFFKIAYNTHLVN